MIKIWPMPSQILSKNCIVKCCLCDYVLTKIRLRFPGQSCEWRHLFIYYVYFIYVYPILFIPFFIFVLSLFVNSSFYHLLIFLIFCYFCWEVMVFWGIILLSSFWTQERIQTAVLWADIFTDLPSVQTKKQANFPSIWNIPW